MTLLGWNVIRQNRRRDAARAALLSTVESFAAQPVTAEELARAKAKWLKQWDLRFTNPEQVGVALSEAVAQGDWRLFFLLRDRVKALSVEQVQKVAVERLQTSNRTLGVYVPTDKPLRAPAPVRVDVAAQLKDFKPQSAMAQGEAFDATPANIDARTQRFTVADGAGGGLKVALLPKSTRGGAVHAQLSLRFGDEKSLFGQRAVAEFVAAMLDKGSAKLTRQQIQDRLNELQSEVSIGGGAGEITVSVSSRRDTLPAIVVLVGELLREPAFSADVLEEVRRQALAANEQNRQEPEAIAQNQLARHGNPYPRGDVRHARTFDEIDADLRAVTLEQVREFHRRFVGASHAQFGASGDMDPAALRPALERALGGWRSESGYVRVPNPMVSPAPVRLVVHTPDKQNAVLFVRQALPLSDNDADYPAFTLANWLLGGGSGDSRLWKRIREKDGLSYGVQSWVQWSNFEANSPWNVYGIFAPANRAKVEAAFAEEVARAYRDGFSEDELKAGVRGLLSFRKLSRAQDERVAGMLASNLYLDRTFAVAQRVDDAIAGLRSADVNAALRKYLKPGTFVVSLAGNFGD